MFRRLAPLTAALVLLAAATARADAIDVQLKNRVFLGKGMPELQIAILEPIAGFHVQLTRSDGHKVDVKGGGRPGLTRVVRLEQPEGHFEYEGSLTVKFPNGREASMSLSFATELLGPLKLNLDTADVDLAARRLKFTASRPLQKAKLRVLMDTGELAVDREVELKGEAAGTPLTVEWPKAEGRVMQIALTAYDTSGFYAGVEVSPWRVDVPHEEVLFDSGKAQVRPDQRPKLDDSYKQIAQVVAKYGKLAAIKLYIAGHTDTVGDEGKNRTLSIARAKAIGQYLRAKGMRIPILYEGFGEEALMVSTRDEQDEPKNRRAEYILSIEDPVVKGSSFRPTWRKL